MIRSKIQYKALDEKRAFFIYRRRDRSKLFAVPFWLTFAVQKITISGSITRYNKNLNGQGQRN
jgi:hypothetical protein